MHIAVIRRVSSAITRCELTHITRQEIDHARACAQHLQYENALRGLGVDVVVLEAEPDLPDSVFVEDAAVVLDEIAILTRPGAATRRPEVGSIASALAPYRGLAAIQAPDTLDGGDVLVVGRTIHVGLSSRSTAGAIEQLRVIAGPEGYDVHELNVADCLHLKSAVTQVGDSILLINPLWVSRDAFPGMEFIEVDPTEPQAANAVLVGETIVYPSSFPATRARLEKAGVAVVTVDADELAKAEGAVTCCSLLFQA